MDHDKILPKNHSPCDLKSFIYSTRYVKLKEKLKLSEVHQLFL